MEWEANKVKGYGQFTYNGKSCYDHRIAYRKIPEDKPFICHRCDNPPCCNPNHLFPGTMKDNFDDKTIPRG